MKEKSSIRIGHLKIVDHLILGIADLQLKNNESELNHCVIKPILMNSWDQLCEALTDKEIDGAFITAPLAMDLFAAGLDIRLLMFTHRAGSMIVKQKGIGIRSIADFKGKTVLIPSELSIQNMLLHRLFSSASLTYASHDVPHADVVYEVVNPFLMQDMMANDTDGEIAGFAVAEPYASQAIHKEIAQKICLSDDLWKSHPCSTFVMNSSVVKNQTLAIKEMIELFVSTAQNLKNLDENLLSKTQTFLDVDKQIAQNSLSETAIRFDPSLLIPDTEALNTIALYMQETMGVLKNKISIKNLVDDSFILNSISESDH